MKFQGQIINKRGGGLATGMLYFLTREPRSEKGEARGGEAGEGDPR